MRNDPAPPHYTYPGVRFDGTLLWLERLVTRITWQGEPALLSTIIDVTERIRTEEERQRLEDQLCQAQKMEAIGTLAGGIAHDFNNILTAIMGYTELAMDDVSQASPPWSHLQEVLTASTRAKDLVQQILAFSRGSAQERKPVQLQPLIREGLTLLRASLPTTIEIRQSIPEDAGKVIVIQVELAFQGAIRYSFSLFEPVGHLVE